MSKALDYLVKARPEAMQSYFAFLKQAGKRLDPRTRAIISVITKVDNQTEAGFRQYLKRALNEGVSADEILDALLLAFPSLGLTKIVWAIDILLEMDLQEFALERLVPEPDWHPLMPAADLTEGHATSASIDGKLVYLIKQGGQIAVYDSICPHQSTQIGPDNLQANTLTCPRHHWKFNLETGECIDIGNLPLCQLRHKITAGKVYAFW